MADRSRVSEGGTLEAGRLRSARTGPDDSGLLPDQMRLAKPWPGHPDRTRVGFAEYGPCLLWKNGTETDAVSRIRHVTIRPDCGCTLTVMAITGRKQNASGSDPACLLGLQNTYVTIIRESGIGVRIGGGGLSALGKGQGRLKALSTV